MTKSVIWVAAAVLMFVFVFVFVTGCGDKEDPNPNAPRSDAGGTASTTGLSSSYNSLCARCHGDRGLGQTVSGTVYPPIPGNKDESAFVAVVRSGRGANDMPAFDESQITDADLKADYLWLTTKRQ